MNILITGSKGFVGQNLVWNLRNIKEGKNQTRAIGIDEIFEYDIDTDDSLLEEYVKQTDFVFDLAGVNRPKDASEFMEGNCRFTSELLELLKKHKNTCPVMYASSIQASLEGRFAESEYGRSKLAGEDLLFAHSVELGSRACVYRFPNLFGKWSRPNYNSVVATFCYNYANDLPIRVDNPDTELELLYIDDLVDGMLDALEAKEKHCRYEGLELIADESENGRFCYIPITHTVTLGEIVELLKSFRNMPQSLIMPDIAKDSFAKKLYSTYLSYLPADKIAYPLHMNVDNRGIFTELIKSNTVGQVSINIARPGITRGEHWHNSKWEIFMVVSGHGLIQERKIGINPETGREYDIIEYEVHGEQMKAVQMLPGYTHNIINLSDTNDLVTVMWANEFFDQNKPDTFYEKVDK